MAELSNAEMLSILLKKTFSTSCTTQKRSIGGETIPSKVKIFQNQIYSEEMPATVADAFTDASASIGTAAAQVVQTKCLSDDNDFWLTTNQTVGGVQYGHYKVADLPANKSFFGYIL